VAPAVRTVTGRLVAGFGLVLSLVLAAFALYVGRSERASILTALDDDLATVSALLANQAPVAAIEAHDRRTLDAWADRNGRALGRRITVIAPDGNVVRQVKMPDVYPTNICFGGRDMKTAYITLSGIGQLAAMDWPEPGLRLNFQE